MKSGAARQRLLLVHQYAIHVSQPALDGFTPPRACVLTHGHSVAGV